MNIAAEHRCPGLEAQHSSQNEVSKIESRLADIGHNKAHRSRMQRRRERQRERNVQVSERVCEKKDGDWRG